MLNYSFIYDNMIEHKRKCHACKTDTLKKTKETEGDGIKAPSYIIYECQECGLTHKRITKNFRD